MPRGQVQPSHEGPGENGFGGPFSHSGRGSGSPDGWGGGEGGGTKQTCKRVILVAAMVMVVGEATPSLLDNRGMV